MIETPENRKILINPGPLKPIDSAERILIPFLTHNKIKHLDAILITTSNPDRVDGFLSLIPYLGNPPIYICSNSDLAAWKKWAEENPSVTLKFKKEDETLRWRSLTCEVLPGSKSFTTDAPLLISFKQKRALLGHVITLKTQKALITKPLTNIDILQARFSPRIKWRDDFLKKFKPDYLVETGTDGKNSPTTSPWKERKPVVPQKLGVWKWSK